MQPPLGSGDPPKTAFEGCIFEGRVRWMEGVWALGGGGAITHRPPLGCHHHLAKGGIPLVLCVSLTIFPTAHHSIPKPAASCRQCNHPYTKWGGALHLGGGFYTSNKIRPPWGFLILPLSETTDTWAGFHHSLLMAPFLASIWACCRASHFPEEEHTTQSQKFTENTPDYGRLFQGPFPK